MSLSADIAKFTDLVQSWASNVSSMFYSDVAADVTIKVINEVGDVVEVTIPNNQKMKEAFETWRGTVNIKNVGGIVVADDESALSVDKFGGLTLAEYDALYKSFFDSRTVGIMPSEQTRGMQPYHQQAFVTTDNRIMYWGYNQSNNFNYNGGTNAQSMMELNQPAEKQGVLITKLWACGTHIVILYADGDLYGRGFQQEGHFGIGNASQQYRFEFMSSNVVEYSSSSNGDQDEQPSAHIIKTDGTVWGSGDNGHGELGIGHASNVYVWTLAYSPLSHGGSKAVKLYTNGTNTAYTTIINDAGELLVTGYNGYGQLGLGDTSSRNVYTKVDPATFDSAVVDFVAGGYTDAVYYGASYVLTASGRVYSCGYNAQGQLCNGTVSSNSLWKEITYPIGFDVASTPFTKISASFHTFYALTASGVLYTVGYNNYGQIGNGSTTYVTSMHMALENVKDFDVLIGSDAVDFPTVFAIKNDNTFWSWGYNGHGEAGLDHASAVYTPSQIDFTETHNIESMHSTGYSSSCTHYLKMTDGQLYACGYNGYGNVTGQTADTTYVSHFTRVQF